MDTDTENIMNAEQGDELLAETPFSEEEAVRAMPNCADTPNEEAVSLDLREQIRQRAEAEGLAELYPAFDLDEALADPELGALLRGETVPDLRRLYEATHIDEILESRVQERLDAAVTEALASALPLAVAAAVAESEERLLGNIRARGQRPGENGISAASGIRMHPAVNRLTRRERAILAERAGRGETIKL